MHSTLAILALLGAGALAHPSLNHRHLHQKRDKFVTVVNGDEVLIEDIEYVTYTGPPATTSTPVNAPENLAVAPISTSAVPVQQKEVYPGGNGWWSTYARPHSAAPVEPSSTPVASPIQTSEAAPVSMTPVNSVTPVASSTAAATSAPPAPSSAASGPAPSGQPWTTSPESPASGGPGAKDVLTQANYWRNKWQGLPGFTWSATLANNSYETAVQPTTYTTDSSGQQVPHNEGGAVTMGHELYPGSMAQCIAGGGDSKMTGDLTPFDVAFLMWICEEENANIQSECDIVKKGEVASTDTGHADIIKSTSYSNIGCYYMDTVGKSDGSGMWTCDFS